ncbi:unnamed protein product, partial [Coregonus sp. 'balchen']
GLMVGDTGVAELLLAVFGRWEGALGLALVLVVYTGSHSCLGSKEVGQSRWNWENQANGYAFSFTQDPEAIHMMRRWEGGDPGVANQKSPTSLLLTPELKFHSFGFAARDNYHDLDPEEAQHWLYFDKFKMKIHSTTDLTMETELEAVSGRKVRAIEVFSHALRFFRVHALKEVKDQSSSVLEGDEVRWVITVPAVWRQPAKQFMREAAYLAGLVSPDSPEQLLIALEPEAVHLPREQLRKARHSRTFLVERGTGELWSEMQTGGPYGAVGVDLAFEAMLYTEERVWRRPCARAKELMQRQEVQGVRFLFLVGGFAESPMLQQAAQNALGQMCRIIIPQDVRVRRCPLTYGVGVLNRFVEGRHPRDKLLVKEGRDWCTDILDRFVSVDQSVALGEVVRRSYTPARSGQRKIIINIYCSVSDDVVYISDPGVRKCGAITLDLPDALPGTVDGAERSERREIRTTMQFGDTEIKVMAVDMATNRTVRAAIDFLSN